MIALIVLAIVILLIIIRRIGSLRLGIWMIMGMGALAVLLTGQISPMGAMRAIDLDVILFLFGVFVIGQALEESGLLSRISERIFRHARTVDALVLSVLLVMGLASTFLMNDTVAVIGVPVVLLLSRNSNISPKLMLLTLAFGVTIGSVTSPIGNPQNLLIALEGTVKDPFVDFFLYLFVPTMINILLAFGLLRLFFRKEFEKRVQPLEPVELADSRLASLSKISLGLMFTLIAVKIFIVMTGIGFDMRLTYIALIAMLPVLLFHKRRLHLVRSIDWRTLVFFAAMFVLMKSVWNTGIFQDITGSSPFNMGSIPMILSASIVGSQFVSNVPMVALYMPILQELGVGAEGMLALAAGSTIAGNLTLIGAASNIIIVQNAERRSGDTLTFLDFLKVGAPLTFLNIAVHLLFFALF
ncbi:MAG: anion transporter [Candidatus Thermoplasmatota archaeon]|nr:anion transporter [Candidatus Thermoplasmatota archaeon]